MVAAISLQLHSWKAKGTGVQLSPRIQTVTLSWATLSTELQNLSGAGVGVLVPSWETKEQEEAAFVSRALGRSRKSEKTGAKSFPQKQATLRPGSM